MKWRENNKERMIVEKTVKAFIREGKRSIRRVMLFENRLDKNEIFCSLDEITDLDLVFKYEQEIIQGISEYFNPKGYRVSTRIIDDKWHPYSIANILYYGE